MPGGPESGGTVTAEQGDETMNEVRLVDLEIIKRYSLAIRQETASAEELLAALDASREAVAAAIAPSKKPATRSKKKATP